MADIISSAGVSLILLAFLLLTLKKIKPDTVTYNLINLAGAALAGVGAYMIGSMPFLILEGIWCLVAVYGILKLNKK